MSGREWTTLEERRLAQLAGRVTAREIASRLGRSVASVEAKARQMQRDGRLSWGLKTYETDLVECPECGEMRTRLLKNGRLMCQVCCDERTLERNVRWRLEAYDELTPAQKAKVGIDMPDCRMDPRPRYPAVSNLPPYEAAKAMHDYQVAVEEWECAFLERNINALKQRTSSFRKMAKEKEESNGNQG